MAQMAEGKTDQQAVAPWLGLSVRQVRRFKRADTDQGIDGLISRRRVDGSKARTRGQIVREKRT